MSSLHGSHFKVTWSVVKWGSGTDSLHILHALYIFRFGGITPVRREVAIVSIRRNRIVGIVIGGITHWIEEEGHGRKCLRMHFRHMLAGGIGIVVNLFTRTLAKPLV